MPIISHKAAHTLTRLLWLAVLITLTMSISGNVVNAEVIGLEGNVQLRAAPGEDFRPAKLLDPTPAGTSVHTLAGGKAKIFFSPGRVIFLNSNTRMEVLDGSRGKNAALDQLIIKAAAGRLRFLVAPSPAAGGLQLLTPTAVIDISRGDGAVTIDRDDHIVALSGPAAIAVKNQYSKQQLWLKPMQGAVSTSAGRLELAAVATRQARQLLNETDLPLTTPPTLVLQPPAPARTPITLADRVNQPWYCSLRPRPGLRLPWPTGSNRRGRYSLR